MKKLSELMTMTKDCSSEETPKESSQTVVVINSVSAEAKEDSE